MKPFVLLAVAALLSPLPACAEAEGSLFSIHARSATGQAGANEDLRLEVMRRYSGGLRLEARASSSSPLHGGPEAQATLSFLSPGSLVGPMVQLGVASIHGRRQESVALGLTGVITPLPGLSISGSISADPRSSFQNRTLEAVAERQIDGGMSVFAGARLATNPGSAARSARIGARYETSRGVFLEGVTEMGSGATGRFRSLSMGVGLAF